MANWEVSPEVMRRPPCWMNSRSLGEAFETEARALVGGGVDAAEVGGEGGLLPGKGVAVQGQAVEDVNGRGAADRGEDDDVESGAEVFLGGDRLGAEIGVGDAGLVEGEAPPAFGLSGEPGVHDGDAWRGDGVSGDGGLGGKAGGVEGEPGQLQSELILVGFRDKQRAGRELFAFGFKGLLGDAHFGVLERVNEGDKCGLAGVGDSRDRAGAGELARLWWPGSATGSILAERMSGLVTRRTFRLKSSEKHQAGVVVGVLLRVVGEPSTGGRGGRRRRGRRADPCG